MLKIYVNPSFLGNNLYLSIFDLSMTRFAPFSYDLNSRKSLQTRNELTALSRLNRLSLANLLVQENIADLQAWLKKLHLRPSWSSSNLNKWTFQLFSCNVGNKI